MSEMPIYLDYNATTPVDPAVVQAMLPYFTQQFGNPSSDHAFGLVAADAMAQARQHVARLIGCQSGEVVFTSCASESSNLAIKGVAFGRGKGHLITSAVEHPATLNACRYLADRFGFGLTVIPVGPDGRVDPASVQAAIRPDTILISLMHAQNETGVIQPVTEVGRIAGEKGILYHVDAAQTLGKIPVSVAELGCDLMTVAGHKLYAPKGVGLLYVRDGVRLDPLVHGAAYEGGRRGGTGNVPYAVALGVACDLARAKLEQGETERLASLRDRLRDGLAQWLPIHVTAPDSPHLPNTLHLCVEGVSGLDLLAATPGVAASTGSACHSGIAKPSDVLLAMGMEAGLALGALRLSLGRFTTAEQVDGAVQRLVLGYRRLRSTHLA